jgi:uncharacterized protein
MDADQTSLRDFIGLPDFPCVMAKAVANQGFLITKSVMEPLREVDFILTQLYSFIDEFRSQPQRLSSFILVLKEPRLKSFEAFEKAFWPLIKTIHSLDKQLYPHDPRVGTNPDDDKFSFSLKSEAFFILTLHPQSPRWARRFKFPAIVFNPHVQFERLRSRGIFKKVRNLIRYRDKLLQGSINPMLNDFGEKSEVFQYLGKVYGPQDSNPLLV